MAACEHCGAALEPDDRYCGECGQPVFVEPTKINAMAPASPEARPSASPEENSAKAGTISKTLIISFALTVGLAIGITALLWSMHQDGVDGQRREIANNSVSPPIRTPDPRTGHAKGYYVDAAKKAYEKGNLTALKRIVDEGLGSHPDSPELWSYKTLYHLKSKPSPDRNEQALRSAKKALELAPTPARYANVGWVYHEMMHDCFSALKYYKQGDIDGYANEQPSLYYHMARCYEQLGDRYNANDYYGRFLRIAPNHKHAPDTRRRLEKK